ncbi:MAG: hypothetical protein IKD62_03890, partial [Oscillospiraceae bacterium]|nr:hypothetical protein [Oscillospiraceae bacterium]
MFFETETSRTQAETARERAETVFSSRLKRYSDALFRDGERKKIIVFTDLPFYAPVLNHIVADPQLHGIFSARTEDILIDGGDLSVCFGQDKLELDAADKERFREIRDTVLRSPGTLNGDGELLIDLKAHSFGSHYGVNLLLGDRSEYADCLQSTPKSVLDEFGRGSFRGRQEKQVLATRYVLSPEENGEPANRQFYITENGRQIFYSLDTKHNVRSAVCCHSQNRTVITYETECGMRIIRTIFLLPQEEGMPSAVEVQRIRIVNLKEQPRDLRIVVTGMFGITDPGTLAGDIIYANVVVESELFRRDGQPVAMAAHHQPKECDAEKRFAMLLNEGRTMDEYCSSLTDFIGTGSLERPEMVAALPNAHSRRQAAFFAMAKSFRLETETTVDCFVGMDDGLGTPEEFGPHLAALYEKYKNAARLSETFENMVAENARYSSFLTMESGDPLSDAYISKN